MAKRKRSSFAKIAVIFVALLVALSLLGVGVSYWSQTLIIITGAEIGTVTAVLSKGDCYIDPPSSGGEITCNVVGNVLEVAVTNAQIGVNYHCPFDIENTGTIPVKIQSIELLPLPPPGVVEITGVAEGYQIDPGPPESGAVRVSDNFTFTVTFTVVQWNQYVP